MKDTVLHLRKMVKQSGYIIIDDSCLKNKSKLKRKGYEHYKNYHEPIKELTFFNDKIINEINTSELSREINYGYLNLIKPRAEELIKLHPELESELMVYIKVQEEECKIIDEELDGWIWVLQKAV